ncbi:helicase-like protein [Sphingobacterium allocomposti]|uniref:Helicase-like protein n=2 Tax=Sphingobacterium allocomposti TaxID=415956 RepID=A0A5S5D9U2_9SPHI|nr:helicase-like protein [Sphingobacterium composti Yoo et al. 2007 non Ten et al. 2007]
MNSLTPYHVKYFAYELTKRSSSDSMQKLASTLVDAQVDLNPHQVDAALFAFRSPLSKGAILADEVGLGKTIEAGLVISQKWAERKRKIIIITPANLRKQWSQELQDKFFLNSVILEAKSFNEFIKKGKLNPFDQPDIIICSYQFARTKEPYLKLIQWDLAVVDEAHRLRNVYKANNKIAKSIKDSLIEAPKILLTATPLQNSLLELYGLVSIIDDYSFGDLKSFKTQYSRVNSGADAETFNELKERLKPICKRTLRRQVLEYIRYTNRIALVEEFFPTEEEQRLYDMVSDYLQADNLYALPASQRKLMTLILRRLLASSTFAISGTLEGLANKLEGIVKESETNNTEKVFALDFETYDELKDEWEGEEDEEQEKEKKTYTQQDIENIRTEIDSLKEFEKLAKSIRLNSKGEKLFTALEKGFNEMARLGAPKKAIIFTESTRTQLYLRNILEARGYADKVVLFNGSNTDEKSRRIYADWVARHKNTDKITGSRTADMRAALVDYFRDEATIMIATEAAAEGINLQFCSMVINYDMPWNPQRIEQRIGRCHRYGQKYDVVVVNFLNKANAADVRVYELLRDKFQLFNGVFGASDEVLGSIENGVDFEKRIARIYQECRTTKQIEEAFNELQSELEVNISDAMQQTRQKLLENFDEEVHEKLRINLQESKDYLSRYESWLWNITQFALNSNADFSSNEHSFRLLKNPYSDLKIHPGPYRIGKAIDDSNVYRIGHPLAQRIIEECKKQELPSVELTFDYSNTIKKISTLELYVGQSGYMLGRVLSVTSFDVEEFVQLSAITQSGNVLSKDICERFFSLPASISGSKANTPDTVINELESHLKAHQLQVIDEIGQRNANYFEIELEKLDLWGEDRRNSLKITLKDLDQQIKDIKKQARLAPNLPEKLKLEKERKKLESERDTAWREYDGAAKEIEQSKDRLIEQIEQKLQQELIKNDLFLIKWNLI